MSDSVAGGKVTALKVQKHHPNRVNVYLDNEFCFGLSRITAAWLQVGQELSPSKIAKLQAEDTREMAYMQALHFLDYRPRSRTEVRRNLEKHAVPPEVISDVFKRLERSGLVNDERFAQDWVENRSEFRPRSRRALAYELHQRGLDDSAIEKALEGLNEETMAYQAALNKHAGTKVFHCGISIINWGVSWHVGVSHTKSSNKWWQEYGKKSMGNSMNESPMKIINADIN
jgi:regulatory protein